jgi:hypothetical protein
MVFDTRCIYYIVYLTDVKVYTVEMCEGTPYPGYFAGPFNQQQAMITCERLNNGQNTQLTTFF